MFYHAYPHVRSSPRDRSIRMGLPRNCLQVRPEIWPWPGSPGTGAGRTGGWSETWSPLKCFGHDTPEKKNWKWISLSAAICIVAGCGVTTHLLLFLAVADLITQRDGCLRCSPLHQPAAVLVLHLQVLWWKGANCTARHLSVRTQRVQTLCTVFWETTLFRLWGWANINIVCLHVHHSLCKIVGNNRILF